MINKDSYYRFLEIFHILNYSANHYISNLVSFIEFDESAFISIPGFYAEIYKDENYYIVDIGEGRIKRDFKDYLSTHLLLDDIVNFSEDKRVGRCCNYIYNSINEISKVLTESNKYNYYNDYYLKLKEITIDNITKDFIEKIINGNFYDLVIKNPTPSASLAILKFLSNKECKELYTLDLYISYDWTNCFGNYIYGLAKNIKNIQNFSIYELIHQKNPIRLISTNEEEKIKILKKLLELGYTKIMTGLWNKTSHIILKVI